jgi:hypothetical protein
VERGAMKARVQRLKKQKENEKESLSLIVSFEGVRAE